MVRTQSTIISDPKEFFTIITSEKEDVNDVIFLNDDMVEVRHTPKVEFAEPLITSNIVIAAFTTASARLRLYEALEIVNKRVLYMDTDSIVYIGSGPEPVEGNSLGELKSELKPAEHIVKFLSAGAKNYGYLTNTGNCELKVRGFTLNRMARQTLNFGTMEDIILNNNDKRILVNMGTTIKKGIKTKSLHTVPYKKSYRMVFDKRILLEDHTSIPFGYKIT